LTENNPTQTQNDVLSLSQLVDDLGRLIDQKPSASPDDQASDLAHWRSDAARLLAEVRMTLEGLGRKVENQEKERQQLAAMQSVGALINSSLDQSQVLNTVMDTIIELSGAERGFLMLTDEMTGELAVEVARNINRETIGGSDFEISRSIVGSVAETGTPVVTTNAQADPRFSNQESIISYNLRSILCVPLKIKETTIGVIYADNRIASGIFTDTDRDLLAAFANQAAVAIENARLFKQIRDQLADITEMKNLQDDVFESIASGVITIDPRDRISLYNRAAESILSVPQHRAINRDYRELLVRPMGGVIESLIERVQEDGGYHQLEIDAKMRGRSGTTTLNLTLTPLRDIQQFTQGVALVLDDVSEQKRLESIRRYLPPALVDQVRDVDVVQQPQRRSISVVFGDIRGFTTVSEQWEPEYLIQILNNHLSVAAAAINEEEGLIDKYDGDTVMALYNTPLNPQSDHVERSVRTALAVQERIKAYHSTVEEDQRLHFGIGIHCGEAVVGNVGSPLRKDYSAIGDAVNVAERLQEMAQGGQILISDSVYEQVKDWVEVSELPPVPVRGRRGGVRIYALQGVTHA
jgi:adenylate cyclase